MQNNEAARQPYHDLFQKWFLTHRDGDTDVYKTLFKVDKPKLVTIRQTFEASASNTSIDWLVDALREGKLQLSVSGRV